MRLPWAVNCLGWGMIERCILILLTVALVGSLGGFFLYVPILPNLAVTVMLGGLCAMFWLGVRVGRRPQGGSVSHPAPSEGSQLSLS
jgi:hypothetical protein